MSPARARVRPPQCPVCGAELKRYNGQPDVITADGNPARWGGHGDNLVCSHACGRILLVRIVRAIPNVIDLLPADLRADATPPPTDPDQESQGLIPANVAVRRRAEKLALP